MMILSLIRSVFGWWISPASGRLSAWFTRLGSTKESPRIPALSVFRPSLSTKCVHSRGSFRHILSELRPMGRVNYPVSVALVGACAGGCIWDIDGSP